MKTNMKNLYLGILLPLIEILKSNLSARSRKQNRVLESDFGIFNAINLFKGGLVMMIFLSSFVNAQAECIVPNNMNQTEFVNFLNANQGTCDGTVIIPAGVVITMNSTITVPNHINTLIIKDGGRILWSSNNVDLILPQNTSIIIENTTNIGTTTGALGSTTSTCSNNRRVVIGTVQYAACNGGGNVCLIFADLIQQGGTPRINVEVATIGLEGNEVCAGSTLLDAIITGLPAGVTPTSYSWTQQSGPSTASFDAPNQQSTNVTAITPGTYIFRLTITIPLGPEGTDCFNQSVTVFSDVELNFLASPVADFTFSEPTCDLVVNFDGSTSTDPNGNDNLQYEWDFNYDGENFNVQATGVNTQFTFPTNDRFNVALRVIDSDILIECQEDIKILEVVFPETAQIVTQVENTEYCVGSGPQGYAVTQDPGYALIYYASETSELPLEAIPSVDTDTADPGVYTVWVSQIIEGECESARVPVSITVNAAPNVPESTGNITVCALDPIQTLDANDAIETVSGITYRWYATATGGSEVIPTLSSIGTATFYVEAVSEKGCASLKRTPVTLTINDCRVAITKEVDFDVIDAPTTLNYTIRVTNPGNTPLTGVVVTDPLTNEATPLVLASGDTNGDGNLDTDETWVYNASYAVDQDMIDAGTAIVNTAFVNTDFTGEEEASVTTTITQAPAVSIEKVVDLGSISAPQTLTYTVTVTNEGNVTLTGVVVTDVLPNGVEVVLTAEGGESFGIGESRDFTVTYEATQADIDAGLDLVNNVSVASAEGASDSDDATTTITQAPAVSIEKVVDLANISAPQTLTYTVTVTNEGNVTLTGVVVTDVLPNGVEVVLTADGGESFGIGESRDFTVTYEATQADIDAGLDLVNNV
ncbi:DUF7507 domain-containing protein, partial [Belliella pelovolcani]